MRLARVRAIARKEALHVRRDARSLAMAFAIPTMLLALFGWALSTDVRDIRTLVCDLDGTRESRELLARLFASGYFRPVAWTTSQDAIAPAIDAGRARAAIVIPPGFARGLATGRPPRVQAILDGSDAATTRIALGYLEGVRQRHALERAPPGPGVDVRMRVIYNPDLKSRNFIVPGLIAIIMSVITSLLTSLTIAREWERGTMEPLYATPVEPGELILGKLLPYFAIIQVDVALAVTAGLWLFGVPFRGRVVDLAAIVLLFSIGALGQGILISIRARSQVLAAQTAMLTTFLPAFLLSGFAYDIASMPLWLRLVTAIVPARYLIDAVKGVLLKGVGLDVLAGDVLALAVYAVLMPWLAVRSFPRRIGERG